MDTLRINNRVFVPASAFEVEFVRSSGPGGQNVNKVATKVELHVDLDAIVGLHASARARLGGLVRRWDKEGRWLLTCQRTRDQKRNLIEVLGRVQETVARAMVTPKARRPSRPSDASRERRLHAKKHRAGIKTGRARNSLAEE
jgi:ribosome-associated protein